MRLYIVRAPFAHRYIVEYIHNAEYYLGAIARWYDSFDALPAEPGIVMFFYTSFLEPIRGYEAHRVLLVNTEQLTIPTNRMYVEKVLADHPSFSYVDYSMDNLEMLELKCPWAWLPFLYHPRYASVSPLNRIVPLLFYGWLSDYRKRLCDQYQAKHVELYGSERDRMIRMSKCVLNIHFSESHKVFESYRIHHAIFLGTPVFLADCEPERVSCLSDTAKMYLLKSPDVPALPPLNPTDELEIGRRIVATFISRLSLPTQTDLSDAAPLPR